MKPLKSAGAVIPIPGPNVNIGNLPQWGEQVRSSLMALRDKRQTLPFIPSRPTPIGGLRIIGTATAGRYYIKEGTVNGEMPTLDGTDLDDPTRPTFDITQTTWAWLKVVGTFGSPDTYVATIEVTTSGSPPTAEAITGTGFTGYFPIGRVVVITDETTTYSIRNEHAGGNLLVRSMGNSIFWGKA